jgi:hypothetical protein
MVGIFIFISRYLFIDIHYHLRGLSSFISVPNLLHILLVYFLFSFRIYFIFMCINCFNISKSMIYKYLHYHFPLDH